MSIDAAARHDDLLGIATGADCLPADVYRRVMHEFLKAIDHQDPALVRAYLNSACESFAEAVEAEIDRRSGWLQHARSQTDEALSRLEGQPLENVDEHGSRIEAAFDQLIESNTKLRNECVRPLLDRGIEVANSGALDTAIDQLRASKTEYLGGWPWSTRPLPPVDREMVRASRSSLAADGGERLADLISRFSSKDVNR